MPELPEVETIVRELRPKVIGRRILGVSVRYGRIVRPQSPAVFGKSVKGRKIISVDRRGKLIIIKLSGGKFLLVHLKMTGQLIFNQKFADKHTHLILNLNGGQELHYNDQRKFGFVFSTDQKGLQSIINDRFQFGPEPLGKELTEEHLETVFRNKKAPIKALLLNQKLIAGLGNIYADESLFRAGIHPARRDGTLNGIEIEKLHKSIRGVLRESIAAGGSSARNYRRTTGELGKFQDRHRVYQRHGEPCLSCGTGLERIVVAGRGTHFCKRCQT